MRSSTRPWGVLLCGAAAVIFATPTLLLPAESPTGPKLVFVLIGSVVLGLGATRIRREGTPPARGPHDAAERNPDVSSG